MQRAVYLEYVLQGFSDRERRYPADSAQAKRAIQDAREQLESMNYYHSIREEKERQEKALLTTPAQADGENNKQHIVAKKGATSEKNDDIDTNTMSLHTSVAAHIQHKHSLQQSEKISTVRAWLQSRLPELYSDDLQAYAHHLVQDGFDSVTLLQEELREEDLAFMKTAHRRRLAKIITASLLHS
jgi:lipopolysaccharide export LptBFGC system permease protein LptF